MEYFKEIEERVILVGVQMNDGEDTEESLEELSELAKTAGAQTVGTIIQNREAVHPGTYIGKGKIEEVRSLVLAMDTNGVQKYQGSEEFCPLPCSQALSPDY